MQQLVANQLQKPMDEIETERGYFDMGLTSLGLVRVTQGIQNKIDKNFQTTLLFEYMTVFELAAYLAGNYPVAIDRLIVNKKTIEKKVLGKMGTTQESVLVPFKKRRLLSTEKKAQSVKSLSLNAQSQFPELIHLNEVFEGRPVFWFHGGLGGVQPYHVIAEKSQRPFYGIQARGYQTERSALHGIQAMAAYYIHMIQSVQPEGPYDLGGYSLGGMISYEVARQLQEFGAVVDTITMLDTYDESAIKTMTLSSSSKGEVLQAVNSALVLTMMQDPKKMKKTLIHRDQLDVNLDDQTFLEKLVGLAQKRGLKKTKAELQKMIRQIAKVQHAYEMQNFSVFPLLDPQAINCYYFRNKSGLFFGDLEPYYTATAGEVKVGYINYWSRWKQQLPNFHIMDVDSSNHTVLLSEPKVHETILDFCQNLYSEEGMTEKFLKSFKRKTKRKHGTLERKTIEQSKPKKIIKRKQRKKSI